MYVAPPGSERGGACVLIFGAKLTSYINEPVVQLPCAFWGSYLGAGVLVGAWWVVSIFCQWAKCDIRVKPGTPRPPALTSSFSVNVDPRCWLLRVL